MIAIWTVVVAINCQQPRVPFREFYAKTTSLPFPGYRGEDLNRVNVRIADTLADYADYSETYRDKCHEAK